MDGSQGYVPRPGSIPQDDGAAGRVLIWTNEVYAHSIPLASGKRIFFFFPLATKVPTIPDTMDKTEIKSIREKFGLTAKQLGEEMRAGPTRESNRLREVLEEVADGVRSAAPSSRARDL